ncbi:DUF6090 family protein [Sediminicola arcticus]|jgi:hypothetical protein|uniref:DUF6090 family protein n=1 Tax=Sediminicola arcticus TaxID=1574308 RepID=A0ABV2SY24_9FLAO|tara:strand:- start:363 stop:1142 length:780 start_codon:yes stop_codon:yes gene_type:complete
MIKFFRKIRQKMLTEYKFSKYLLYAIGEIVLVVIGILIALQLNNLNEIDKVKDTEVIYLNALHDEFSNNLKEVERVMKLNKRGLEMAHGLLGKMGTDDPNFTEKVFDSLMYRTIFSEIQYRPSPGTLIELVNSGKLSIISNRELRLNLASWDGVLASVLFQEEEHSKPRYKLIDLMNKWGNGRKSYINALGNNKFSLDIPNSNFNLSSLVLLQNIEFDNQLTFFFITGSFLNSNYYSSLKNKIENTLNIIQSELNQRTN